MDSYSSTQSSQPAVVSSGVENAHVIDVISFDEKRGEVALVMREARPWDGSDLRLFQLQEKVNAYLSFALDGEMAEAYPAFVGKNIRLQLESVTPPDHRTLHFIEIVREQIGFQGIKFAIVVPDQAGCACGSATPCGS